MALAALAALASVVTVLAALHGLRPDVDVLVQPISAYARGPYSGMFAAALAVWGGSAWLIEAALWRRASRLDRALLTLFGAGLVVAAVFPMDVPFPPDEWTVKRLSCSGVVHITAASVSSLVFPVVAVRLSPRLGAARGLRITAAFSAVAAAAVFSLPFIDVRYFGLAQRAFAALVLAWLIRASASLLPTFHRHRANRLPGSV